MSPIPTIDEFGNYLTNKKLRKIFYEIREKFLRLNGDIFEKINQQYINLKYKGESALTIYVTRKRIDLGHYDLDGNWVKTEILEDTKFDCEDFIMNQQKVLLEWDEK